MTQYNDEPMSASNERIYNYIVAMELTVLDCEKMGLTVEKVEFDGAFPPRIFVRDCNKTRHLTASGKAQCFGRAVRNGVSYDLMQMKNRECKILWQADRLH